MNQIDRLEIDGLFTFKHPAEIEFLQGCAYMVYGENSDKGYKSNGAGKSSFLETICIALTGDSYRDIKKDEIINDDLKQASVCLYLSNPVLKTKFSIKRTFTRGKSSTAALFINGVEQTQLTSVDAVTKELFGLLGISQDDFFSYFLIGEFASKPFLSSTDSEKKEIITRLSKTTILDKAIAIVDEDLIEVNETIGLIRQNIETAEEKIELLLVELDSEKNANENRKKEEEKLILSDIKINQEKIDNTTKTIVEHKKLLSIEESKYKKFSPILDKIKELGKQEQLVNDKINASNREIRGLERMNKNLQQQIEHAIVCPNCNHKFLLEEEDIDICKKNIENNSKQIKIHTKEIEKQKLSLESIEKDKDNLQNEVEKFESVREQKFKLQEKIDNFEFFLQDLQETNDRLRFRLKKLSQQVKQNDRTKEIEQKIQEQRDLISEFEGLMPEAEQQKELFEFWKFHFSKKGFGSYLINNVLGIIEGVINRKLKQFNVSNAIKINGYTKLKSGELREKIDVLVSKDGVNFYNYKKFSAGERGRLNISSVLALQSMINDSIAPKGLNFLGIDESFDKGLDSLGLKACIDTLESSKTTTILISHLNDNIGVESMIKIQKQNGVSQFSEINHSKK